jgi:spoIIIJ-associated protein
MKEVVASGRTVDDAKREALRELGVESEEDVEIEVIDEGSKGVFGWGTKFARVKVKLLKEGEPDKPKPAPRPAPQRPPARPPVEDRKPEERKPEEKKIEDRRPPERKVEERRTEDRRPPERKVEERKPEEKRFDDRRMADIRSLEPSRRPEDISQPIRMKGEIPPITVGEIPLPSVPASRMEKMRDEKDFEDDYEEDYPGEMDDQPMAPESEAEAEPESIELLEEEEGGPYNPRDIIKTVMNMMGADGEIRLVKGSSGPVYSLEGKSLGALIGKHGQTLEAMQFIINLILMRRADRKNKITIDIEGYRVRREKSLRDLARRLADKARRDRKNVVLEPMLPSERRIIHLSLQNNSSVFTYSQGEEPMRRVVISPKKKRTDGTDRPEGEQGEQRQERPARTGRYERPERPRTERPERYERSERR